MKAKCYKILSFFLFYVIIFLSVLCEETLLYSQESSMESEQYQKILEQDNDPDKADEDYWVKIYGGYTSYIHRKIKINQTADGGYIVGAQIIGESKYGDLSAIKLDGYGDVEWHKGYGLEKYDNLTSIHEVQNNGYLLTGNLFNTEVYKKKYWAVKLDFNGAIQWQKAYGGKNSEYLNSSIKTSDGGFILSGITYSYDNNFLCNILLLKIDEAGNIVWEKVYETGKNINKIDCIKECPDGSFITIISDRKVMKIDFQGNLIWCKYFDDPSIQLKKIALTSDSGFIISSLFNHGSKIIKIDFRGDIVWSKVFEYKKRRSKYFINTVKETSDGGYILLSNNCTSKYYTYFPILVINDDPAGYQLRKKVISVVKLNSSGDILWEKSYRNKFRRKWFFPVLLKYNEIRGCSILETSDGDYIIAGTIAYKNYSDNSMVIIKMNSNGEIPGSKIIIKETNIKTRDCSILNKDSDVTTHESNITVITDTDVIAYDIFCEIDKL